MSSKINTIGVLTSGGDAPGMNAAVRAVVRRGIAKGKLIKGINRGYAGMLKEEIQDMDARSVCNILQRGGTFLESERCPEFELEEMQDKAIDICRKHGIDALVVIGGDGSFRGAQKLAGKGLNVIGIPGTIDGDIGCTDYTIGFDTAVNTAMHAIDNIRDTASSHEKCSIIEVMGRNAGHIALWCGIANGAEQVLIPEKFDYNEVKVLQKIVKNRENGKKNNIIINAEGIGDTPKMAKRISAIGNISIRTTILSYIQRGGVPTCKDRVFASVMGAKAVDLLCEGACNRVVAYKDGQFVDFDIDEALEMRGGISEYMYEILEDLSM
ncbi:MAG: 6-phosphofructokinase [Lachnospiraceae bacterium]|nr:6-phosphofructokinase [Lachnospiraceae bacterium]